MDDDFSQCLVLNTRRAARAVTRAYNRRLRPYGITSSQFSLLISIARSDKRPVTALAGKLGMERTTLTRNLDLLERRGLVVSEPGAGGNARLCTLTAAGSALVEELLPEWRKTQKEMGQVLAEPGLENIVDVLQRLSRI